MEVSPTRNTHFQKHAFFASDSFLSSFWNGKWSQNHSKRLPEINKKTDCFYIKKTPKMSPIRGSMGGPTNQLFAPKFPSGTPWAPQAAPERLQRVPWTIVGRFFTRFHDFPSILHQIFFDFVLSFLLKLEVSR